VVFRHEPKISLTVWSRSSAARVQITLGGKWFFGTGQAISSSISTS
jgi:hypothetical protein